jgi:hypothetical protein
MMNSRTYLCFLESEVWTLPQNGPDSKQSGSAKKIPTACESSIDTFQASLNSTISATCQQTLFGKPALNARPYCPEVSHVSRLAVPESEEARMMTGISGRKCLELCKSLGQLGSLEKMLLESSEWHSMMFLTIWSIAVTRRGRSYFRLRLLEPSIGATGASLSRTVLIPTPDTMPEAPNSSCNRKYPKNLLQAAQDNFWPTMTASDASGHQYTYDGGDKRKPRLSLAGMALLPTPTSRDRKDTGDSIMTGKTPVNGLLGRGVNPSKESGSLNPNWVEWLMGFPPGWTDLEHSETPSSRSRSSRSSRQSQK